MNTNRSIRLLTMVEGDKYLDYLELCLFPSLFQPNNLPKILASGRCVEHCVICRDSAIPRILSLLKRYGGIESQTSNYLFHFHQQGRDGLATLSALVWAMDRCLNDGSYLMLAMPDWFFGDGSISRMLDYAAGRDYCVAGLSLRVNDDSFMRNLLVTKLPIFNPQLVDMVFRDAHVSLKMSDVTQDQSSSRFSGVFTQPLGEGLWSVVHRLPNVFLASITKDDVDDFRRTDQGLSHWDWVWPSKLIQQGRYRYMGSSDLFFMAELTSPHGNVPLVESGMRWNDDVVNGKGGVHIETNKLFVGCIRGSKGLG